jgi:hypothetical protein
MQILNRSKGIRLPIFYLFQLISICCDSDFGGKNADFCYGKKVFQKSAQFRVEDFLLPVRLLLSQVND